MAKPRTISKALVVAIALSLLNIVLLIAGINWASDIVGDLASGSSDDALVAAADRVENVKGTLDQVLIIVLIGGAAIVIPWTVASFSRSAQDSRRENDAAAINSYQRNLSWAKQDDRRADE